MIWLLLFGLLDNELSGTWKIREPLVVTSEAQICEFRNAVAHVTQEGNRISGRYEAMVSCTDPAWPTEDWGRRVGTFSGTVSGDSVNVSVDARFQLVGRVEGDRIHGSLHEGLASAGPPVWSAGRIRH